MPGSSNSLKRFTSISGVILLLMAEIGTASEVMNYRTNPVAAAKAGEPYKPSIINGDRVASRQDAPWVVGIKKRNSASSLDGFICGGTLIADYWVLTAAHCVIDLETGAKLAETDLIVIGETINLYSETRREVIKVIPHPEYKNSSTKNHDIALLRLNDKFPTAKSVRLASLDVENAFLQDQSTLIVFGWGITGVGSGASASLRSAELDYIDRTVCNAQFYFGSVKEDQFCAGGSGKGTCHGDSGGPILHRLKNESHQIGVTSAGLKCESADKPSIYTRISQHMEWITTNQNTFDCAVSKNAC